MNFKKIPVLGRFIREDKGQTLAFTAVILTAWTGVTGIAVDAGKGYYAYQLLKASTNAAALAGAAGMPDTSTATTYADNYGSATSAYNASGVMNTVVTNVSFECLGTVTTDFYAPCENSQGTGTGSSVYNAVQVNQTAKVPTWIGPLFGMSTFNIQATSTASMKGGSPTPYNIAIVLDTTQSMNGADDGANNGSGGASCSTQIACAKAGIQVFLKMLVPGTTSSPVDSVALFVFPGMSSGSISDDYNCSGSNPTIVPYTFSNAVLDTADYNLPSGNTYEVIPFTNNYQVASGALNTSANLVIAVGGKSGCTGIEAPGGEGTYYAQVIYAAQAALVTEQNSNGYANMMILLSDGDATACNQSQAVSGGTTVDNTCSGSNQIQTQTGTLNGTEKKSQNANYDIPTFPSAVGECGQAVVAAQAATAAGTKVYTIGYGSEMSGCPTDSTWTDSGSSSYGANSYPYTGSLPSGAVAYGPCYALGAMATDAQDFFTDNENGCAAVDPNNTNITTLAGVFSKIGFNLTAARLIPNGTT